MNATVKVSKCLDFSVRDNGLVEVTDILKGSKFLITKDIYAILTALKSPHSRSDIIQLLSSRYELNEIQDAIQYMETKSLIVDSQTDETFVVKQSNEGLYGFNDFKLESHKQNQIVFCGIPFGAGNPVDSNCKKFSAFIRHFIKQQHISFAKDIESVDFRFLSSLLDFSILKEGLLNKRFLDWGDLYLYISESPATIHNKIYTAASKILRSGNVPFLLGGDHSISWPAIKACSEHFDQIQIIHFDAHIDAYYTREASIYGQVPHHGNFMAECMKLENVVKVSQFGIRGIINSRPYKHRKQNIYWSDAIEEILTNKLPLQIDSSIPVYVTFDIDVLDPQIAPATATPVPNGLSYKDICLLFDRALRDVKIVGVDFVEVNPERDKEDMTLHLAANLILMLLNFIK